MGARMDKSRFCATPKRVSGLICYQRGTKNYKGATSSPSNSRFLHDQIKNNNASPSYIQYTIHRNSTISEKKKKENPPLKMTKGNRGPASVDQTLAFPGLNPPSISTLRCPTAPRFHVGFSWLFIHIYSLIHFFLIFFFQPFSVFLITGFTYFLSFFSVSFWENVLYTRCNGARTRSILRNEWHTIPPPLRLYHSPGGYLVSFLITYIPALRFFTWFQGIRVLFAGSAGVKW